MSKTSSAARFKTPQRPTDQADAWVRSDVTAKEAPGTGKAARLTVDLPPELHARFKAACALRGTRMGEAVTRFIESYTQAQG